MKRFKSLYKEAKVEVDDISVGVKKKKPAGVKADEPLKGYAYNEKMKFKFKGKKTALHIKNNKFLESSEEITEAKADLVKTIEAEIKKYGPKDIDTPTYKQAITLVKKGDMKSLKKLIYTSDTEPSEFLSYALAQHDPAAFKKMYPRAKAGDYLRSIVIQHGESVEISERRVTDIDVEQSARELKKAKLDKAKEKVQNEDEEEEKSYIVRVQGKGAPGRDYINVKTRAHSQKAALEKIRKQYPGRVSYSIVKEDYDTAISLSIEEIEMNEALSPKEKEKRLLMIKKAVQKLNRANIEKAKKMAMRDMKASGMFDDAINEHIKGGADSYYALQQAKKKAAKMGKVWSKMGQDEKDRFVDKEMKAAGYEKKPGNQMYTKIPTDSERKFADKVRAKDKEVSKMSEPDKIDYFSKNPSASTGGHDISDEGKKKIQIARYQSQIDALEKRAIEAQRKAYEADEEGDDLAYEKYQDEEEYFLERIREVENKIEDLKDE